ncbi:GntR family transcriptional regulator [Epibacterium ulvae]|uniref:GntR family transcriptional regulator n=1 Tax=Epibacterium ulvae TaxID=1156985 RepID=UPI001BFC1671|nr:GntR family transcriptional regulator [Epibacterium ulvae]MBT8155039.1 GntR family transcriptional regulator [Epibacterium ulvae]
MSLSLEDAVAPQLHRKLRERIVSCKMIPGQRISETEIASKYGVSRQPVREAFIKLSEEQLITIRPQRGTFIKRISVPSALTARFVREAVESDLVSRVVERSSPEIIAELDAQIALQKETIKDENPREFVRLDEEFHRCLARFAGMPEVSTYLDGLNVQMNRVRNMSARQFSRDNLMRQHRKIVDAIRENDARAGCEAMRTHLREFTRDLPRIIETYPDYFEGTEALS